MLAPLDTRLRTPDELSPLERGQMFALLSDHFDNACYDQFERDLSEKHCVVTVEHATRGVVGFTTAMRLTCEEAGRPLTALFSGDTMLHPDVWGAHGWMRALSRYARTASQASPGEGPLYWLLLTATHRTYRTLPAFFKEYYPRPDAPTPPDVWRRMSALVRKKFPAQFDAASGVVRLNPPLPVRADRRELATRGLSGPHARFFAEHNPGFLNGDFLVCLTDLSPGNRTRLGERLFRS
jgi:hypothetical protein